MSARSLLRTGLSLGTRTAPKLSTTVPLGACLLAVVLYLLVRDR